MGLNVKYKYKLEENNFSQEEGRRIISFQWLKPRIFTRNLKYNIKVIILLEKNYKRLFYLFKSNKIIYFLDAITTIKSNGSIFNRLFLIGVLNKIDIKLRQIRGVIKKHQIF